MSGQAGPGEAQHGMQNMMTLATYNVGLSGHLSSQLEVCGVPMPPASPLHRGPAEIKGRQDSPPPPLLQRSGE